MNKCINKIYVEPKKELKEKKQEVSVKQIILTQQIIQQTFSDDEDDIDIDYNDNSNNDNNNDNDKQK